MSEYWQPGMQCDVLSFRYDFVRRMGGLFMGENQCCDMSACIRFFEAIDKRVARIHTYAGVTPDTAYLLTANGWVPCATLRPLPLGGSDADIPF